MRGAEGTARAASLHHLHLMDMTEKVIAAFEAIGQCSDSGERLFGACACIACIEGPDHKESPALAFGNRGISRELPEKGCGLRNWSA